MSTAGFLIRSRTLVIGTKPWECGVGGLAELQLDSVLAGITRGDDGLTELQLSISGLAVMARGGAVVFRVRAPTLRPRFRGNMLYAQQSCDMRQLAHGSAISHLTLRSLQASHALGADIMQAEVRGFEFGET